MLKMCCLFGSKGRRKKIPIESVIMIIAGRVGGGGGLRVVITSSYVFF